MEQLIETILPHIIALIELIGIFIVTVGTLRAFWYYLLNLFHIRQYKVKHELANSLATGLEFKMAAEILNTVLSAASASWRCSAASSCCVRCCRC